MAQNTHHFFSTALSKDRELVSRVDGNIVIFPDRENLGMNLPAPYLVVKHSGTRNGTQTKDFEYESDEDIDTISVLVVAETDEELCSLATMARQAIRSAAEGFSVDDAEEFGFELDSYQFMSSGNSYNPETDKLYVEFTYTCTITNIY